MNNSLHSTAYSRTQFNVAASRVLATDTHAAIVDTLVIGESQPA